MARCVVSQSDLFSHVKYMRILWVCLCCLFDWSLSLSQKGLRGMKGQLNTAEDVEHFVDGNPILIDAPLVNG